MRLCANFCATLRFRRALTQAVDRDGLARSLTNGPFFRPWPGGLFPGSDFFNKESVVYYPFSPDTSRALLAEIGLKDTDNDGILNWTEGPMAGKNVEISMTTWEDISAGATLGQALTLLFQDIGIKVNFRILTNTAMTEANTNGEWEMRIAARVRHLPHRMYAVRKSPPPSRNSHGTAKAVSQKNTPITRKRWWKLPTPSVWSAIRRR